MTAGGGTAGCGVSREALDGGAWLFVVHGEVDLASADRVRDALMAVASDGAEALVVDLSGCTFLDSSGLRALLEARRALAAPDGAPGLVIAAPGDQPRRLLEMTRMETVMPVFATREEAEAVARRAPVNGAGPSSS
jgi:anti-sigma B factor antagonist